MLIFIIHNSRGHLTCTHTRHGTQVCCEDVGGIARVLILDGRTTVIVSCQSQYLRESAARPTVSRRVPLSPSRVVPAQFLLGPRVRSPDDVLREIVEDLGHTAGHRPIPLEQLHPVVRVASDGLGYGGCDTQFRGGVHGTL